MKHTSSSIAILLYVVFLLLGGSTIGIAAVVAADETTCASGDGTCSSDDSTGFASIPETVWKSTQKVLEDIRDWILERTPKPNNKEKVHIDVTSPTHHPSSSGSKHNKETPKETEEGPPVETTKPKPKIEVPNY